jgi:AraC family transcriptional regulator of arabinose operon
VANLTDDMRAVEALLREKKWDTHTRQQGVREHLAFTLLAGFLRETGFTPGSSSPAHPAVENATAWARRHLHEAFTLPDLAHRAGISPAHLIRLFKRDLGRRPMEWVWEQRCCTAADHLRDTGLGIKEIAYRCGFPTPQHFSRRFRKYSGLSPTAHRMAVRGNGEQ